MDERKRERWGGGHFNLYADVNKKKAIISHQSAHRRIVQNITHSIAAGLRFTPTEINPHGAPESGDNAD